MTASFGVPKAAHVGECQNIIKGADDTWRDSRECGVQTLALGGDFPLDRDLCQECAARGKAYIDAFYAGLADGVVAGEDQGAEWSRVTDELIADDLEYLTRRASERAPMRELRKIRVGIDRRIRCAQEVEAARMSLIK